MQRRKSSVMKVAKVTCDGDDKGRKMVVGRLASCSLVKEEGEWKAEEENNILGFLLVFLFSFNFFLLKNFGLILACFQIYWAMSRPSPRVRAMSPHDWDVSKNNSNKKVENWTHKFACPKRVQSMSRLVGVQHGHFAWNGVSVLPCSRS